MVVHSSTVMVLVPTSTQWYINGINAQDMSSEEIADRGIIFSGFVAHYSSCYFLDFYLTMAGNCLNNNSQIHCVILGDEAHGSNATSNTATLTVEGCGSVIILLLPFGSTIA